jgi:hypothetical protein
VHVRTPSIFYHDLSTSESAYWASQLLSHALATGKAKSTGPAWREIPSSYFLPELDMAIPIRAQDAMVTAAREAGADIETERCTAGNSPFMSMPEVVARSVERAAGEEGE